MRRASPMAILAFLTACLCMTTSAQEQEQVAVRRLAVRPAAEPVPAMRYRLLPTFYEREPGNAATVLKTAALMLAQHDDREALQRIGDWAKTPLDQLPLEAVRTALSQFESELHYVELGAWRERCDWDWPLQEGAMMLLPDLAAYRNMARLLALQARMQILERDYEAAIHTLQTGFALASHVAEGRILINGLVGSAIASVMVDAVEDLMQAPDAPSLYWALAALPRPLVDLREAIEFEMTGMAFWPKELRKPERMYLSPRQWAEVFRGFGGLVDESSRSGSLSPMAIALVTYTDAKRHLLEKGQPPEEVEAMPVLQVVAIYLRDGWRLRADALLKWWYVPYPQARVRRLGTEQVLAEAPDNLAGRLAVLLMPALQKARFQQMKLERRRAGLQAVEAIRLHAGATGGLPERLEEIERVPVPLNPMRDEPFEYELRDGRAVLSAPLGPDGRPEDAFRYEIEMVR